MTETSVVEKTTNDAATPLKLDAAVIGAGVAGLYQLHLLRQQGMNVKAFDAASGVGGTWYWNRYPGARFELGRVHLPIPIFGGSLQRLELEREVPRPAGDRAVAQLGRRQTRPAPRHPVQDADQERALRRGVRALDPDDRQRPEDRHAIPGHLLRHAIGTADRPVSRAGQLQGQAVLHQHVPEGRGRSVGQARWRRRQRCDRHPGDPDGRQPGRTT